MATELSRQRQSGVDTKGSILNVSTRIFAEKGFLGASLSDIVSEVGIAKPSLFHHFPNKERLYIAVLGLVAESLESAVENCRLCEDPVEGLIQFAKDLDEWSAANPASNRLVMREMLDINDRTGSLRSWPLSFVIELLRGKYEKLPQKGRLAKLNFTAFLAVFLGSISYLHLSRKTLTSMAPPENKQEDISQAGEELVCLFETLLCEEKY